MQAKKEREKNASPGSFHQVNFAKNVSGVSPDCLLRGAATQQRVIKRLHFQSVQRSVRMNRQMTCMQFTKTHRDKAKVTDRDKAKVTDTDRDRQRQTETQTQTQTQTHTPPPFSVSSLLWKESDGYRRPFQNTQVLGIGHHKNHA